MALLVAVMTCHYLCYLLGMLTAASAVHSVRWSCWRSLLRMVQLTWGRWVEHVRQRYRCARRQSCSVCWVLSLVVSCSQSVLVEGAAPTTGVEAPLMRWLPGALLRCLWAEGVGVC